VRGSIVFLPFSWFFLWANKKTGMDWLTYTKAELGIRCGKGSEPLNVYIQPHALRRLAERLDCIDPIHLSINLYFSLRFPVITEGRHNYFLILYQVKAFRAGYLVAGIHEGTIVIHTFLFLTNNGTPEGEKLAAATGLAKLDKEYLTIDKLSTFWESDIQTNEDVKRIFINAGCASLFEPDLALHRLDGHTKHLTVAERIHNYLSQSHDDKDFVTFDKEQLTI
jgi:hypothetical protein